MKSRFIIILLFSLGITGLTGCAFFNTYFNARKAYNNGMASIERSWEQKSLQRQPTPTITADRFDEIYLNAPDDAKQFFATAIEKGNKVVVLHSDSRWVEQAILLLGKAHFLRGAGNDYYDAKNRFEVFFLKYPNSRFTADAKLWYAKTLIQLNLTEQAFLAISEINALSSEPDIQAEARLIIGEKYFRENRLSEALSEFLIADSLARRMSLRRQACFKTAMIYFNQENFETAFRYFKKLSRLDLPAPDLFDALLMMARSLKHQEKYEAAIRQLDKLLDDNRYKNYFVTAEYEIADILLRQRRFKEAEKQFQFVIDTYRNPQFTGDAYYMLGTMYDTIYREPVTAKKYYHIVKTKYPQSSFTAQAEERFTQLSQLEYFHQTIRREYDFIEWLNRMIENPDSLKPPPITLPDSSSLSVQDTTSLNLKDSSLLDSTAIQESTVDLDKMAALMDTVDLDSLDWLKKLESGKDLQDLTVKGNDDSKKKSDSKTADTVKIKSVFEKDFKEAEVENKPLKDQLKFIQSEQNRLRDLQSKDSLDTYIRTVHQRLGLLYFELADFFFYVAKTPDSSLYYYTVIIDSFFLTSSAEPALYAIAGIYEKINPPHYLPALRKAYNTFPNGQLNYLYYKIFSESGVEEDTISLLFQNAELALVNNDFDNALTIYHRIAKHDTTYNQCRALFMMGTIHEKLNHNESAYRFFKTLSYRYPGHPLTEKIKNKIEQYAVRQGIPNDSTIFFIDTNYVQVDLSSFRKDLKAAIAGRSADTTIINVPADSSGMDSITAKKDALQEDDVSGKDSSGVQLEKEAIKDSHSSQKDSTGVQLEKDAIKNDDSLPEDSTGVKIEKDEGE